MVNTPVPPYTVPNIKLNDGHTIPIIGFGTGQSLYSVSYKLTNAYQTGTANYGQECTEHVLSALKAGYRYLDGAQQYRNTGSIRDAFQAWGGKRDEVYILTKCPLSSIMT